MEINYSALRHLIVITTLPREYYNHLETAKIICIYGLISIHETLSGAKLTAT